LAKNVLKPNQYKEVFKIKAERELGAAFMVTPSLPQNTRIKIPSFASRLKDLKTIEKDYIQSL
jgi:hypothetical protein